MDTILDTIIEIKQHYNERGEKLDFIVCNSDIYRQIVQKCRDYLFSSETLTPVMLTRVFGVQIKNINQGY